MKRKSLILLLWCALFAPLARAQWTVSPEAGMNVTKYVDSPAKVGYKIGAAVRYAFPETGFSLQSGLYFVQRGQGTNRSLWFEGTGVTGDGERVDFAYPMSLDDFYTGTSYVFGGYYYGYGYGYGSGMYSSYYPYGGVSSYLKDMEVNKVEYSASHTRRVYIQVPIMARYDWKINDRVKVHLALGPYIAVGVAGRTSIDTQMFNIGTLEGDVYGDALHKYTSSYRDDPFDIGRRFDWGITAEAGVDIGRWYVNVGYDMGLGKEYTGDATGVKYHTISLTVGYKF